MACCDEARARKSRVVMMLLAGIPKPWSGASGRVRAPVNNNNMKMCLNFLPSAGHTSLQLFLTPTAAGTADGIPADSSERPHLSQLRCAAEIAAFIPSQPSRPNTIAAAGRRFPTGRDTHSEGRSFLHMSSPRERVAKMPRASTTSYGQVIEVSTTTITMRPRDSF